VVSEYQVRVTMSAESNFTREQFLKLCQLRELFSGRFSDEEAAQLLFYKFGGDLQQAASYVLFTEPADLRREMDEENASWTTVCGKAARLKESADGGTILRRARRGQIETSARLFACQSCDQFWWMRIPDRKPVSKCRRCKIKYDAIARDREWGRAEFNCTKCNREFSGFCGIWATSPCYRCGDAVRPFCIRPPTRDQGPRRSNNNGHRCNGAGCGGRGGVVHGWVEGSDHEQLPNMCVHPITRRALGLPIVVIPSRSHDSSGSTVDTFLPQGDLCLTYEYLTMPVIDE